MPAGDAPRDRPATTPPPPPPAFEFATAARIVFGAGSAAQLPGLVAAFGRRILLVTGSRPGRFSRLTDAVGAAGGHRAAFSVAGEPTVEDADAGARLAREDRCDVVLAIGGGSVIDAGKAIAALAAHDGEALDFLEVVGRGHPLTRPSLPFLAVPTTAGTGAEVTRNAVLGVPSERVKASLRSPFMLPRVALVDPELAHGLPAAVTAASGMDALTQLIEPFLSPRANPVTDALCRDGIARAAAALPAVVREPGNADARSHMALASLQGGLALANAGLGAVHGFAAPLGGGFPAPHGAVCAALLPHVLRVNLAALNARSPEAPAIGRMAEVARMLTGRPAATAGDAAAWCAERAREFGIPSLSAWGVGRDDLGDIARKAARASSMKANPIVLTQEELVSILEAALS